MQPRTNAQVEIARNGPYRVSGNLPLNKQVIGTNAAAEGEDGKEAGPHRSPRCGKSMTLRGVACHTSA